MDELRGLTALGVRRPVLITVVNLLVILLGCASLLGVEVRELPDVDRPVVTVRTVFNGAAPETMDAEVTSILEGAVARVPGVRHIDSASEEDNSRLRIEFQTGTNIDSAANDVREAVSRIQRELPDAIDQLLVVKADDDAQAIIQIAAYSDNLSKEELAKQIEKDVAPELLSVDGVADVYLDGDQPRVLRILLDPTRLAGYRISVSEVVDVIRNARLDVPAGSYKSEDQELVIRAYATVVEPERVERLFIRDNIRVGDVGEVFYSPMDADSYSLLNRRVVIGLGVVRQSGSSTITISDEVDRRLAQINTGARDYQLVKISDDSVYIKGALKEVLFTLVFAMIIVLVVIALFLGQWEATLIPAVTMPVSLIGTLAAIWLLGFSINLLTLLALVLATGLIVDDAIVVLENIQRRQGMGLGKMAAAVLGTRQVFFAVVATTLTLVSVFLPIAFLPGETGRLFREFGLVLAIAVGISSFVALTLCPMMTARLPDRKPSPVVFARFRTGLAAFGTSLALGYYRSLGVVLNHPGAFLLLGVLLAAGGVAGYQLLGQELLPEEDRGTLMIRLTGPDGASLNYSDRQSQRLEAILQPYQDSGLIKDIYTNVGRWDPHRAFTIATLRNWDERDITQMELVAELDEKMTYLPGAQIRISRGQSLGIRGNNGGLELAVTGSEYDAIYAASQILSRALLDQVSSISDVRVDFDTSQPELYFNINREKASDLNVSMEEISLALRVMVDRFEVINMSVEDQAIPVMMGSTKGVINDPGDLLNIFVINENRELIPLNALITVAERGAATQLERHAQRRAIEVDIGIVPGLPLGDVMSDIRRIANEVLPPGHNIIFLGEAATLTETSHEVAITFLIAILVVFLVLAAQFESIGSAIIVIFTVPFGLAAAVFALLLSGGSINLYSQIGLVMLVGIMTKNAILLIEFMDQLRDEGKNVRDAIMEGVSVRLRPVTMTVLSTVLGSLPLILSSGPGAEARNAIGWVVFGGLGLSTLFTLYYAPLGYSLLAPFIKPRAHAADLLAQQMQQADGQ